MLLTYSYTSFTEKVLVGEKYYFGQLWNGKGDGKKILNSKSIIMDDFITTEDWEEVTVKFEVIEKNNHNIFQSIVKVIDICL